MFDSKIASEPLPCSAYDVETLSGCVVLKSEGVLVAMRTLSGPWLDCAGFKLAPEHAFAYEGDPRVVDAVERLASACPDCGNGPCIDGACPDCEEG